MYIFTFFIRFHVILEIYIKIFLYPCKHFGKAVFAICLNISVYSRLFFFQDFRGCIVGGL